MKIAAKTYVSKADVEQYNMLLQSYTKEFFETISVYPENIGSVPYYEVQKQEIVILARRLRALSQMMRNDLKPRIADQKIISD